MLSPASPSISLFSGAGGLDLGLENAGLRFATWVEIDRDSSETLRRNFEIPSGALLSDLTEVDPADLLKQAGASSGEVFAVAGGPPCQAFSTAGHRLSIHDPRGALVESYFDIVDVAKPRFFVFENVRGLLSAALSHRPLSERGAEHNPLSEAEMLGSLYREFIRPRFEAIGYEVVAGLVDAADYGVPQRRTRVIVVGSREGEFKSQQFVDEFGRPLSIHDLMPPSHTGPGNLKKSRVMASVPGSGTAPWTTLRSALTELPDEEPEFVRYTPSRAEVFRRIPTGKNWRYIRDNPELFPPGFLEKVMGGALTSTGGRVGFFRRLAWDEPAPTLTTSPVQLATGLCHPVETRPLSVQEYKRIQDFPASYFLAGSAASKYKQIGNAVPVGLAEAVGRALVNATNGQPWIDPKDEPRQLGLLGDVIAPYFVATGAVRARHR